MRKLAVVFLIFVICVVTRRLVREAVDWYRHDSAARSDIAARPWKDAVVFGDTVAVDVPWRLEPSEMKLSPETSKMVTRYICQGHSADRLSIATFSMEFSPGASVNLAEGAAAALANLKSLPGMDTINSTKKELSIGGRPGIEFEGRIRTEKCGNFPYHCVFFFEGRKFCQVLLICDRGETQGAAVWERMRKSLLTPRVGAAKAESESTGLPAGVRRRALKLLPIPQEEL